LYNINWFTNPENVRPWIAMVCRERLWTEVKKNSGKRGMNFISIFNVRTFMMMIVKKSLLGCPITIRNWNQWTIR
jgi:hypothetical protein